jgi:hypothetical protein
MVPTGSQGDLEILLGLLEFFFVVVQLVGELTEKADDISTNFVHSIVHIFHVLD